MARLHVAHASGEAHRRPGVRAQPRRVGPGADDEQGPAQAVKGFDGHVDALVGVQPRQHQEVGLSPRRRVKRAHVNRRMQHGRRAPVELCDAPGGVVRVGEEGVDALSGRVIPDAQRRHDRGKQRARDAAQRHLRDIVVVHPGEARWTVAVADVIGVWPGDDALGERAGAAQHDVVRGEVKRLKGQRVEGQQHFSDP